MAFDTPELDIQGIIPIIPTPFHENGEVDFDGLAPLIHFAAAGGCCAVCLPAYASEFYKLTDAERQAVVETAVMHAGGRIPVIGQANHPYSKQAALLARAAQQAGAAGVAVAVPRIFALNESDLFRYFVPILSAIDVPLVIQDFNPGGASVSPAFVASLHREFPHFRYIKLEEPLMAAKTAAVLDATQGRVGVLEGWGGMHLIELMDAGICGVMPGLGVSDILARVFSLAKQGNIEEAFDLHHAILPQIVYSLQNLELFHHCEKQLLAARGVPVPLHVRDSSLTPGPHEARHIDFLNAQAVRLLQQREMPLNPAQG